MGVVYLPQFGWSVECPTYIEDCCSYARTSRAKCPTLLKPWWARQDSNLRPNALKGRSGSTLPY